MNILNAFPIATLQKFPHHFFSNLQPIQVWHVCSNLKPHLIIFILLLLPTWAAFRWGVMIPPVLFTYSFLLIISRIFFDTKFSLRLVVMLSLFVMITNYYQSSNKLLIHSNWGEYAEYVDDKLIIGLIFSSSTFITWLIAPERQMAIQKSKKIKKVKSIPKGLTEIKSVDAIHEYQQIHVDKLQDLSYLAEIGRYLSGLIHDISTPLNVITLNIYELANYQRYEKKQHARHTNYSMKRALHSAHIIEQYIDTARQCIQQQTVFKKYLLKQSLELVMTVLRYKAALAQVKIEVHCDKNLYLYGNPTRFNQIVTNLISNAIDSYDEKTSDSKTVLLQISRMDTSIQLYIQDFGKGISSNQLESIFTPFFTTKNQKNSMGLGLSIVHQIVEKEMDGTITVQSTLNKGTIFRILIPVKSSAKSKAIKKSSLLNVEYTNTTNDELNIPV